MIIWLEKKGGENDIAKNDIKWKPKNILHYSEFLYVTYIKKKFTFFVSEFDQFLAERSTQANSVPTISAAAGQRSGSRNRQLQKDEEENPLFAL